MFYFSPVETLWSTESDAEEEEEKKETMMFGNESFRSTISPEDNPTTKSSILDKLIDSEENRLWSRRLNLTEYDELHENSKHDASPGNNVDRDSLENVNFFLQDNPVTDSSANLFKEELVSTEITTLPENGTTNQTTSSMDTDELTTPALTTSFECAFGDRKCKSSPVGELQPLKYGDKLTSPTINSVSTGSFWNVVKSEKSSDSETSDMLEVYSSSINTPNYASVTVSPSESTSAQTSENVILIDGTELDKEESVIQNQSNKSEKLKPIKHPDGLEIISDEKSLVKITVTTPLQTPTKEIVSIPEIQPSLIPTSDTRQILINSTTEETPFYPDPSLPVEFITPTIDSALVTKTESFTLPESPHIGKMQENPSADHSKILQEIPSYFSSLLPTPSWHDGKSYTNTGIDKHFKGNTANAIDDVTPILSPSFRQSVESRETKRISIQSSSASIQVTPPTTVTSSSDVFTPALDTKPTSRFTEKGKQLKFHFNYI